jgi:hypothetical protein
MIRLIKKIYKSIIFFISSIDEAHRMKASEVTQYELRELENLFVLLLMGSFTGIPSPSSIVSAELIPHLSREIEILNKRAEDAFDAFNELAGTIGID